MGHPRLLIIALAIPLCMAMTMLLAGRQRHSARDRAFAGLCLAWTLDLATDLWPWETAGVFSPRNLNAVSCCAAVLALTCFAVLAGPATVGPRWNAVAAGAAAAAVLATTVWIARATPAAGAAWLAVLTAACLLLLARCLHVLRRPPRRNLLAWSIICFVGSSQMLHAAWLPYRQTLDVVLLDAGYLALVMGAWMMSGPAVPALASSSQGEGGPLSDAAQARLQHAVALERQRIAQELHDSLGSHLTGLIARQDRTLPGQQAMAAALEECLLELRIVVDSFHDDGESLVLSLARLRYRIQPSLDQLAIRMQWNVEDADVWSALPAAHAKELLRIAQESLTNVMRHSHATQVAVTLCCRTAESVMVLEVRDNGSGGDRAAVAGQGLAGMRRRAQQIGARFEMFAEPGFGTRVWVGYPLRAGQGGPAGVPGCSCSEPDCY